ncbi:MAG: aminotransferase class V-fold PLP-dependent enzyme [Bacteroidia bacterium]|nr:aminotransferase class V-fold PLP-dependent enzyme [Bacteroidia bacterium]
MKRKHFLSAAALLAFKPTRSQANLWLPEKPADNPDESYWQSLRNLFPLDAERVFLNNGTMGITPYPVLQAVQDGFLNAARNGHYPGHNDNLQKELASVIGADVKEVTITKNVSEGVNLACWGIPLKSGDEVIMTTHEHVGGCFAWLNRARMDGICIKTFQLGKTAAETLENLEKTITRKTKVIAVPHIPCTIGQILPVKEICQLARSKNIISAIDGAHPLGMIQFNVHEMGCDYYSGCLHKWMLGPLGMGYFYVRQEMLEKTRCTHVAAYSGSDFNMAATPPVFGPLTDSAQRFTYGTFCGPAYAGGLAAIQLYKQIGAGNIERRGRELAGKLQESLLEFGNKIEMLTPVEAISRGCQIGFRIKNGKEKANSEFVNAMALKKIVLRYVGENGIDCVRVSTHYYNSPAETAMLVDELKKYLA